jgi:hypothetical protein
MPRLHPLSRKHRDESPAKKETPEQRTRNAERGTRGSSPGPNAWGRDHFMRDLYKASGRVSAEIDANPDETARLKKARKDVEEGRVRWENQENEEDAEA